MTANTTSCLIFFYILAGYRRSTDSKYNLLLKVFFLGRLSKIYYGTRTHKQIAQVVKELKRTAYKDVQ